MNATTERQSISLDRDLLSNQSVAFEPNERLMNRRVELARVMASSFLKFTPLGGATTNPECAEALIQLHHLCQELECEALRFLREEGHSWLLLAEDSFPLNELLLQFANYRLTQASRAYYFESLLSSPEESKVALRDVVDRCRQDFDSLIQSL